MKAEESRPKRSKLRIATIVIGIAVLIGGGLVLLNMSASKANGADQTDQAAEDGGDQNDKSDKKDGEDGEDKEKAPIPVEVSTVTRGEVAAYIDASANLVAENQVKVLSEVEGRISQLFVDEGKYVGRGQVLATLVRDDAEIGLKKATLRETNARLAYERGEDLIGKELISREDFDQFTMDYEIAKEELAEAQWTLEKTTIRSPFSGLVSERMIQVGQHIRPGDELFQVTDSDPLIARIFLPERDVLGLEVGREVKIGLSAAESVEFVGRVRQISPVVDVATGTVKVTIEAADPPAMVRPGSFVGIHIVREAHPDALLLPREAVLRELQTAHVFVADGETATKREVALGLEEEDLVEILGGVEAGEQVIVAGQGGLKDGSAVRILAVDGVEIEQPEAAEVVAEAG